MSYYLRGERRQESTKETDVVKARRRLKQRMREVGADFIGAKKFAGPQSEKLSVNEILDSLTKDMELRQKLSKQVASKLKPVRAAFGLMAAISVTDDMIRDYMLVRLKGTGRKPNTAMAQALARLDRTNPVSNATINRELQLLKQAFNLRSKEIGSGPSVPKLEERIREWYYERAEFEAIVKLLPEDLQDFARWGYFTGCNKIEVWLKDRGVPENRIRLRSAGV
jgi:hypothetical protein